MTENQDKIKSLSPDERIILGLGALVPTLPSVEQMRREIETGEFSPESIAIANSILEGVEPQPISEKVFKESYYADFPETEDEYMARTNAELRQRAIDEEDSMKISTIKPSQVNFKKLSKGFTELGDAMVKASEAAAETALVLRKVKKPYVPQDHLTHRPFHSDELKELRDQLRKAQR